MLTSAALSVGQLPIVSARSHRKEAGLWLSTKDQIKNAPEFIEDDFLNGQRLNPPTDGRPDPRPDARENAAILGNLNRDFNFNQRPRPPLLLPLHPQTDLIH